MPTCVNGVLYGWGTAAWGTSGWGGYGVPVLGGPIPTVPPFDVFCLCSGYPMEYAQSYDEVSTVPADHFAVDVVNHDLIIVSADSVQAELFVDVTFGPSYTLEFSVKFTELPDSFVDPARRIMIGAVDTNGYSACLLFAKTGIAYQGNPGSPFQVLPDSASLIQEGVLYACRVVVNAANQAVFVYFSEAAVAEVSGLELKYILPLVPYSGTYPAAQGVHAIALGTPADPASVSFDSICMSSRILVSNVPPIADAGGDQAVRACSIIRLDGSKSFDPEGAPLSYQWRLIDGPVGSSLIFEGLDGHTYPEAIPTNYTDKLYSSSFGGSSPIPIDVNDVLFVEGEAYNVTEVSSDGHGDFVRIARHLFGDGWSSKPYKIAKQNGLKDPQTDKPTFYPDLTGFWRFDLVVFDGALFSAPSVTVINVLQSMLPRGVIPDASFIWNSLSDFWKLLEDSERINTFWSALMQVMATELYTLWQLEYGKSLRDIQRTFIRRWLHYDLLLREPFIDLARIRTPMRGVDSAAMPSAGLALSGCTLTVTLPDTTLATVTLQGTGLITPENAAKQIREAFRLKDKRFDCQVVDVGSTSTLRLLAPFHFEVSVSSGLLPFTVGDANEPLEGTGGVLMGSRSYQLPFSLSGLVAEDDVLVVLDAGTGQKILVRVAAAADAPTDPHRSQRLLLKDDLPLTAGDHWYLPFRAISTQLDFYGGLVTDLDIGAIEIVDNSINDITYHDVECMGAHQSLPNSILIRWDSLPYFSASPDRYDIFFWGVYRRGYMPIESAIVDIPHLQRVINGPDEDEVLRANLDFFVESFRDHRCIRFSQAIWDPETTRTLVPRLWAEYNFLDNSDMIEANFGIPVGFRVEDLQKLPETVDYLHAVRGLWYAYTNGPTLRNLRIGTQILLGLPFAEEAGTILEIRTDFSPTQGRILIEDTANPDVIRSYPYPRVLDLEVNPDTNVFYVVGDKVKQFAPLVTGVEVVDYVKDPYWLQGYLSQGVLTEVEKFFRFLVRVSADVFNLSALIFAREFIRTIKPTYTSPIFAVSKQVGDEDQIDVQDDIRHIGQLHLEIGSLLRDPHEYVSAADVPDPSPGWVDTHGIPRPWVDGSGDTGNYSSHVKFAADTEVDRSVVLPTYPTADFLVRTHADRGPISTEMAIWATQRADLAACPWPGHVAGRMVADSIYRADFGLYDDGTTLPFGCQFMLAVTDQWREVLDSWTVTSSFWVSAAEVEIVGDTAGIGTLYSVRVLLNDVEVATFSFLHTEGGGFLHLEPLAPFRVTGGDVLRVEMKASVNTTAFWYAVTVTLGSINAVGHADAGEVCPFPGFPDPPLMPETVQERVRTL